MDPTTDLINVERIRIDLRDIDRQILELLHEGRCTPRYLAGQLDVVQQYVSQRLRRLVDAQIVTRVDRGLYELHEDYRRDADE